MKSSRQVAILEIISNQAVETQEDLAEELGKRGIADVAVSQTGCIGICQYEPVVEVFDENGEKTTYVKMSPEKAVRVVNDHIVNGNVVTEFTIGAVK